MKIKTRRHIYSSLWGIETGPELVPARAVRSRCEHRSRMGGSYHQSWEVSLIEIGRFGSWAELLHGLEFGLAGAFFTGVFNIDKGEEKIMRKLLKLVALPALTSKKRFVVAVGAIVAACAAGPLSAAANLLDNGSFEEPVLSASFVTVVTSAITGWTIVGNVDHIGNYWAAQDGSQSVDLNGFDSMGSLTQSGPLTPGQLYNLSFYLSGNPDGPPDPKTLDVRIFDTVTPSILSLDQTGVITIASALDKTLDGMNWTLFSYDFLAAAGSGTYGLLFQSTTAGSAGTHYGPALDNVSITLIPEPEIYAMLAAGLGLMGFVARRRRQQAAAA